MNEYLAKLDAAFVSVHAAEQAVENAKLAFEQAKERLSDSKANFDLVIDDGEKLGVAKARLRKVAEERYNVAAALGLFANTESAPDAKSSEPKRRPGRPRAAEKNMEDPIVAAAGGKPSSAEPEAAPEPSPVDDTSSVAKDEAPVEGDTPQDEYLANIEEMADEDAERAAVDPGPGADDPDLELAPEPAVAEASPVTAPTKFKAPSFLSR